MGYDILYYGQVVGNSFVSGFIELLMSTQRWYQLWLLTLFYERSCQMFKFIIRHQFFHEGGLYLILIFHNVDKDKLNLIALFWNSEPKLRGIFSIYPLQPFLILKLSTISPWRGRFNLKERTSWNRVCEVWVLSFHFVVRNIYVNLKSEPWNFKKLVLIVIF